MRSRKARKKTLGRKARRLSLPPSKKQKGCRKGIPSFRSFRSFRFSRARSPCNRLRSFPKLPKSARFSASRPFSSPNKPRSPRFYHASDCVLVYLYVQPHTGRGFGRTSAVRSTVHSPCVRPRFSCVSGCVFQPCVIRAFRCASQPCVIRAFRCASQPCVIRAFRCAPNHTARPRNRPQLWQKVRSPGR